jgi:diphosphomevalonate decarboxylase
MHASAMAAEPPIIYWSPVTLAAMQAIHRARHEAGVQAYFTMDAGPHVKTLCRAEDAPAVAALLAAVPGVLSTLIASPGPGAQLVIEASAPAVPA